MPILFRVPLPGPFVYVRKVGNHRQSTDINGLVLVLMLVGYLALAIGWALWLLVLNVGIGLRALGRGFVRLRRRSMVGRTVTSAIVIIATLDAISWWLPAFEHFA